MAELLVSFIIRSRRTSPTGQRVWEDGLAEGYWTSRLEKGDDGVYRPQPVPPGWYELVRLSSAQLEAVQEAIDAADVSSMPAHIDTVAEGQSDSSWAEWQIQTDDGLKSVRVAQWGPLDERAAPLMDLLMQITNTVNAALAGSADAPL
jgi:hypothetical protein